MTVSQEDVFGPGKDAEGRWDDYWLGDPRKGGIAVRFDPGFGLNVHIEYWTPRLSYDSKTPRTKDGRYCLNEHFGMSIDGWESLCALVDEYRKATEDTST